MLSLLLLLLYALLLLSDMFGLKLGFETEGFSLKNLLLYALLMYVTSRSLVSGGFLGGVPARRINAGFLLLIVLAIGSWAYLVLAGVYPAYNVLEKGTLLKSLLIDHYLLLIVYSGCLGIAFNSARALFFVLLLSALANALALADYFNIPNLGIIEDRDDARLSGPIGQPNEYATFIVFLIPYYLAFIFEREQKIRMLGLAGAALCLIALILTGSRGGYFGVAAGAVIASIYLRRHLKLKRVVVLLIAAAVAVFVSASIILANDRNLLVQRYEQTVTGDVQTASAGRLMIWEAGLSRMIETPTSFIWGFGWESFRTFFPFSSHNSYLRLLFDLGVMGLTAYLFIIVCLLKAFKKAIELPRTEFSSHMAIASIYAICSLSVHLFFITPIRPWLLIWPVIGISLAAALAAPKLGPTGIRVRRFQTLCD
jgi:O-antigen ligase